MSYPTLTALITPFPTITLMLPPSTPLTPVSGPDSTFDCTLSYSCVASTDSPPPPLVNIVNGPPFSNILESILTTILTSPALVASTSMGPSHQLQYTFTLSLPTLSPSTSTLLNTDPITSEWCSITTYLISVYLCISSLKVLKLPTELTRYTPEGVQSSDVTIQGLNVNEAIKDLKIGYWCDDKGHGVSAMKGYKVVACEGEGEVRIGGGEDWSLWFDNCEIHDEQD